MTNKAASQSQQARNFAKEKDDLYTEGAELWLSEQSKPKKTRISARNIATQLQQRHLDETGHRISLQHQTITQGAKGRRSQLEYAADREILTTEECELVVNYLISCANQGFPLTHTRLKDTIDDILRGRLGPGFLGVGKKYTQRFLQRNNDRIKTSLSTPLESKRANAVNENTDKAWWDLLETTLKEHNFAPENIYGVDEVGIQPYGTDRERVNGPKKKGPQYQRRTGNRENITILVTICADGTSAPPATIFKGKGYQVKWLQNNPANAS
ncbi:hypothetical protein FA15DRAFT_603408 [Coprinopsis marcescibilis]|uniref:HTH CENPB-type domain-containing protein n=1 Tax=Coprinopsis marcescibilis TaxID=230819 RepID=A0A5C3KF96_COPMA|nr:hypothetical protein FA15DRAFT_603408 [Coprinopsis marcescibilis]